MGKHIIWGWTEVQTALVSILSRVLISASGADVEHTYKGP